MTIRRWSLALTGVVAGWVATLALTMVISDAAPGAIAFLPNEKFAENLPEGAAIVGAGALWVAIRSDAPNLGLDLYRSGARLVLPAGLPGCLPLPSAP